MKRISFVFVILALTVLINSSAFSWYMDSVGGGFDGTYNDAIRAAEKALEERNLTMVQLALFNFTENAEPNISILSDYFSSGFIDHNRGFMFKYKNETMKIEHYCNCSLLTLFSDKPIPKFDKIFFSLVALVNGTWNESLSYAKKNAELVGKGEYDKSYWYASDISDMNVFLIRLEALLIKRGDDIYFKSLLEEKRNDLVALKALAEAKVDLTQKQTAQKN